MHFTLFKLEVICSKGILYSIQANQRTDFNNEKGPTSEEITLLIEAYLSGCNSHYQIILTRLIYMTIPVPGAILAIGRGGCNTTL